VFVQVRQIGNSGVDTAAERSAEDYPAASSRLQAGNAWSR
jgi:hypothetical protein